MANLETLSPAELIATIVELRGLNKELKRQNEELRREIDELRRGGGRSAAPFSKGRRKENPKPPGRKPGEGLFSRREEPVSEALSQVRIEVPVTCHSCPDCGGALGESATEIASNTDLPEQPRPVVRHYEVEVRRCRQCGRKVRGRHKELAPDQFGATAHRLGVRLKAAAHVLHYGFGVPARKVPPILEELTGIKVTQGALTQDALKQTGRRVGNAYQDLRAGVRQAPVVHTGDTGWRTGGEAAQLMVFETDRETVYQIRSRHRNEEVREVIPSDYAGVMVTDRGKSYDADELSAVAQQKCLSHLIRNTGEVVKEKRGPARRFGVPLKALLQEGLRLWHDHKQGNALDYATEVARIERELTHHLRHRVLGDEDNQRLLDGIGLQHDRGHVLRSLHQPGIEPTNNRAERALRPAVIARKVSHCSKNQRGAEDFMAFTSLAQTFRKRIGTSLTDAFRVLLQQQFSQTASP
ncbi:MAG: IS66 family transposase [Chthoniobacterales bacterium]|nr:MAG: IS66 family transposase [Chthoniobacterales bacterium]